jgi:hypothetical protein
MNFFRLELLLKPIHSHINVFMSRKSMSLNAGRKGRTFQKNVRKYALEAFL